MTKIEWTDQTINPIVGCSHAGPGCSRCYAEKMAHRLAAMGAQGRPALGHYVGVLDGDRWSGTTAFAPKAFEKLKRKSPQAFFVNSMGDWFHPSVPDAWRFESLRQFEQHWQHIYQILTKRPEAMVAFFREHFSGVKSAFLPNLMLGASICTNQEMEFLRPLRSLKSLGTNTFVSFEPWLSQSFAVNPDDIAEAIDWGIIGGESGPGSRPFHPEALEQCVQVFQEAGRPLFVKQMGDNGPLPRGQSKDFDQWPDKWRVRQFPQCMSSVRPVVYSPREVAYGSV